MCSDFTVLWCSKEQVCGTYYYARPALICVNVFFIPVSVGYEYESCPGVVHWERRTALMQGFELVPSNLGGWSLDKHHDLNIRSGETTYKKILLCLYLVVYSVHTRIK